MTFRGCLVASQMTFRGFTYDYRTRAIITRGLYIFYPIFHCGLYCRGVSVKDNLFNIVYFLQKDDIMLHFTLTGSSDATALHNLYNSGFSSSD